MVVGPALRGCLLPIVLFGLPVAVALATSPKKPLGYEVFEPGAWRHIAEPALSDNGRTLVYELQADFDGESPHAKPYELVARNLETKVEHRYRRGRNARITADGAYVVFEAAAETEGLAEVRAKIKSAKPVKKEMRLGVMTVASGQVWLGARIKSFKIPDNASPVVAFVPVSEETGHNASVSKGTSGSTLVVRELTSGVETTIEDVSEYIWSKDGAWMAYVVSTQSPTAGVYLRRTRDAVILCLSQGPGEFRGVVFDAAGGQVAFLGKRQEQKADGGYSLYHWTNRMPRAEVVVSSTTAGLPAGHVVSATGRAAAAADAAGHLLFSEDGQRLFFGTAPAQPPAKPESSAVQVDIWHWHDELLQREQKKAADLQTAYRAVLHLAQRKLVPLEAPDLWIETKFAMLTGMLANLRVAPELAMLNGTHAIGVMEGPWNFHRSWLLGPRDYVLVNLTDGSRRPIVQGSQASDPPIPRLSPNGRYVVYFDQKELSWYSMRCADGRKVNLTRALPVGVKVAERYNWVDGIKRSGLWIYGIIGFTTGDRSVLLRGRYDVWEVELDASRARNVTQGIGAQRQISFFPATYQPLPLSRSDPILLRAVDERTMATGFYRVDLVRGTCTRLVMMDGMMGLPREGREEVGMRGRPRFAAFLRAKRADRIVLSIQRFNEYPDLWNMDSRSGKLERVSDANPQMQDYLWGRAELLRYRNEDGKELRASVFKPDNFDPANKYPLLVSIYEQEGGDLHVFESPTVTYSPGNAARYVSRGYVVMKPDIVYQTGLTGQSALKSVTAAVQTVVAQGFIDPQRMGIGGHSFGGYETAYIVTRTNLFKAALPQCAISNLISLYENQQVEGNRAWFESSQGRLRVSAWERPDIYIENSPIFRARDVTTPILIVHNDDDYIPWSQGREFFEALRRFGKEAYLFNYNGEGHGVVRPQNIRHFVVHSDEFFDHHLLGKSKPEWMEKGVPYTERGTRDLTPFYGPSAAPKLSSTDGSVHERR